MLASVINRLEPPDPQRHDFSRRQPPPREASHGSHGPWFSPWPSLKPWWILIAGVALGRWLGYTPHLFVAMAAACLLLGFLNDDNSIES